MQDFLIKEFFNLNKYAHKHLFDDCIYAWDPLLHLEAFFKKTKLGKIESPIPPGAHLVHPELISIGKNTIIEPGAYICGPCVIGEECEVRHGAYIRGYVVTGNRCILGHASEFKHSILLDHVCAGHFNYVGDSILGNEVNLGAGAKLANLRLDHQPVQFFYVGVKIETGLKKLGAIVADGAQLGCNVVTNPGTLIGKKAFCYPCIAVNGYIPPEAKLKSNQKTICQ